MSDNLYEPDEFDEAAEDMPVGVHRAPHPRWKSLLPFLVALIVGPLLAWGAIAFIVNRVDTHPAAKAPASQSQQKSEAKDSAAKDQQKSESKEDKKVEQEEQKADNQIDHGASIRVYNNSDNKAPAGSATAAAQKLKKDGFKDVNAGNSKSSYTSSTVLYSDSGLEATAQEIAKKLGLSNVKLDAQAVGDAKIAVILTSDYKR